MNVNMIFILISITVILNFVKSDPHVLQNPFILLITTKCTYFGNKWSNSLPRELMENKETVCNSVRNSKIFDLNDYTTNWNDIRNSLLLPGIRKNRIVNMHLTCNEERVASTYILPCKWTSETYQNAGFYLGTVNDFEGYILLMNDNVPEKNSLKPYGLVMEFLNLKQISEDGHDIFQKMFKYYVKNRLIQNTEWPASSSGNEVLIFKDKYQFSKLCASVNLVMLEKYDQIILDDYLSLSFVRDDFSSLLNVESSSNIETFSINYPY